MRRTIVARATSALLALTTAALVGAAPAAAATPASEPPEPKVIDAAALHAGNVPLLDRTRAGLEARVVDLARQRDAQQAERPGPPRSTDDTSQELQRTTALLEGLRNLQGFLTAETPESRQRAPRFLLDFQDTWPGRFVLAQGDPAVARHIVTLVPGMTSTYGSGLVEAEAIRARLDARTGEAPVAVVTFVDYDIPANVGEARSPDRAEDGAPTLQRFQETLRAGRERERSVNTVVGHSYGSLVVGYAASGRGGGLDADRVVAAGSPGMAVDGADGLVRQGRSEVWAGTAGADPIGLTPGLGPDPTRPEFGARRLQVGPGGHSSYFQPGSPSIEHVARIAADQCPSPQTCDQEWTVPAHGP